MPWKLLGVKNAPLSAALGALAPEERLRLNRLVAAIGGPAAPRPIPFSEAIPRRTEALQPLEIALLEAAEADNIALYVATDDDTLELVAAPTFGEADRIVWGTVPTDALVGVAAAHRRHQPIYLVHQQSEDLDDEAFARIPAFDAFSAVAYLPFGARPRRPVEDGRGADELDLRRSAPPVASGARRTRTAPRGVLLLGFHDADGLAASRRRFYETLAALCGALLRMEPPDRNDAPSEAPPAPEVDAGPPKRATDTPPMTVRQPEPRAELAAVAEGVAHRCNNLLSSVLTHVASLRETLHVLDDAQSLQAAERSHRLPDVESVRDALDGIDAAVRNTASVTRDLLFAVGQGTQPNGPIALIELLHQAAAEAAAPHISFEVAELTPHEAGPVVVRGDRTALAGVVGQLVANACEACGPHGGRVLLRAGRTTLDDLDGLLHEQAAFFEVLDQGHGMTPETKARMFDPFFSTKFKGRGLGLAATLGIVASHRGMIHVDSRPHLGTRVRVTLPMEPERLRPFASRPPHARRAAVPAGERLRILVAEDDAPLRNAFVRILQREGHDVVAAEDGEAAWALYTAGRGAFDLLLADQTMPRLEGVDLVARVRAQDADLPVILVSAVVGSELRARGAALAVRHVLAKPLFPRELFKAIAELTMPGPWAAHG